MNQTPKEFSKHQGVLPLHTGKNGRHVYRLQLLKKNSVVAAVSRHVVQQGCLYKVYGGTPETLINPQHIRLIKPQTNPDTQTRTIMDPNKHIIINNAAKIPRQTTLKSPNIFIKI